MDSLSRPIRSAFGGSSMMRFGCGPASVGVREAPSGVEVTLANRLLGVPGGTSIISGECLSPGTFHWMRGGGGEWCAATADCRAVGTRAASEAIYRELFTVLGERHLYRIWNFVPRINEYEDGLEVYQQFSFGRSVAFEIAYPGNVESRIPAASAVGTPGEYLIVVAFTGAARPRYFENPVQIPAYRYPLDYGPRAPSFARATAVGIEGEQRIFLSGTAAIRGSSSRHVGDVARQTGLTLENLRLIAAEAGAARLGLEQSCERFFRVYLRNESDHALIRPVLEKRLLRANDHIEYVVAEICRAELDVEIEATLTLAE